MTASDYLRILRARWVLIVALTCLGTVVGLIYYLGQSTEYTSRSTLYVAAQADSSTTAAYQGNLLSQQRVKSYLEIIESTRVSSQVVSQLQLRDSPGAVATRTSATSATDSSVIEVSYTDLDPLRSADVNNAISLVFTAVVNELERPINPQAVPPLAIRVIEPAVAPSAPSSPGLVETVALGLLVGLLVGAGLAIARNALDSSVHSVEELKRMTSLPNLAVVSVAEDDVRTPGASDQRGTSTYAEAFKQLRNNLQFIDVDNPPRIVVVTSSFPEEGKTSTTANLALAMAAAGQRVIVVEADLRKPGLSSLFGIERSVGLTSVLAGKLKLQDAIQPWQAGRLYVLSSGVLPPNPSEILGSQNMKSLLQELRRSFDSIIVDTPPLLAVNDAAALAPSTDGTVIVCRFRSTKRAQLQTAIESLTSVHARVLGTILSRVPAKGVHSYMNYREYYSESPELRKAPAEIPSAEALEPRSTGIPQRSKPVPYRRNGNAMVPERFKAR